MIETVLCELATLISQFINQFRRIGGSSKTKLCQYEKWMNEIQLKFKYLYIEQLINFFLLWHIRSYQRD